MNPNFIAIKVDREERPGVDAIYMQAVRAMSGQGGWPLNVWLTPKGEPFYGGIYFPPRDGDRGGRVGFLTLKQMAAGGIHDHVGGGFHRYSTDGRWRVPHFEKMLYDNAQLALAYLEAYQASGDAALKDTLEQILAYVQREMTAPGGGFHSATDADSLTPDGERHEGYYFTWTPEELHDLLGPERAKQKGFLEDYALFIAALLDLYEATHSSKWLRQAMALDAQLARRFEDPENGGFFRIGSDHPKKRGPI